MNNQLTVKELNKYRGKNVSQLLNIAQKWFNRYIRLRDSNGDYFNCISCGRLKPVAMMHAGHYIAVGYSGALRFNEDNCHSQCVACNTHKHGNAIEYRKNLVKKIGVERVEYLEMMSRKVNKWDRYSLIVIIETYKEKVKELR